MLALRLRGFKSIGDFPDYIYFGGNSEMRGYDYLEFIGQNVVFANAELRFPIIEAALTPIGVIGGIRGVFFANIGGGWFNDQDFKFATNRRRDVTRRSSATSATRPATPFIDPITGLPIPIYGAGADHLGIPPEGRPRVVRHRPRDLRARLPDSLRLVVAHAVQQANGKTSLFAADGGSSEFRKPRFAVWIGYDF